MVKINGVIYESVRDACEKNNVKVCTYYKRIRSGMSEAEALRDVNYHSVCPTYTNELIVDGISYPTVTAACKAFHIKERTYYNRVANGYSIEDALKGKTKGKIEEVVMGKTFPSRKAAMRYVGVRSTTVYKIMKTCHVSFADAVSEAASRL